MSDIFKQLSWFDLVGGAALVVVFAALLLAFHTPGPAPAAELSRVPDADCTHVAIYDDGETIRHCRVDTPDGPMTCMVLDLHRGAGLDCELAGDR